MLLQVFDTTDGTTAGLSSVDTEGVAATRHPLPLETPFREDGAGEHLSNEDALANAPERDGASFVVPRVV
mgnify:CR=1 FL=1